MLFKKSLILIVFISVIVSCAENHPEAISPQIIPIPQEQVLTKGVFILDNESGLQFDTAFKVSAAFLKAFIQQGSNLVLKENNTIVFIKEERIKSDAGYVLNITPTQIEIKANKLINNNSKLRNYPRIQTRFWT
jgi:hexosaminidase